MQMDLILVCKLIIMLFMFSCMGWLMEVVLKYFQYHRFINRGYLTGPYCPIYGGGVVAVTVLEKIILQDKGSYTDVFLGGLIICGALEYFVSWYMEKMYHARWWDYSTKPMNLNGRIWIGNLILFGIGSVVVVKLVNPILFGLMELWSDTFIIVFTVFIIFLLAVDNVLSGMLMNIVKKEIDAREEDNTEEISLKVHALLKDKSLLVRRINEAYPNLQARPERLTRQLKEARKEVKIATKALKAELKAVSENVKNEVKTSSETTRRHIEDIQRIKAEEKELKLEHAKERLKKAKERMREVQEKLTFNNRY